MTAGGGAGGAAAGAEPGEQRRSTTRHLVIDGRMLEHSGIGTYLRHLLPRVAAAVPAEVDVQVLGGAALEALPWPPGREVTLTRSDAPIYSVREQVEGAVRALSAPRGEVYWSPHYNVPLLRRGRMLVTVHDLAHLALPSLVPARYRRAYARLLFRRVRGATARLFDSRFTADEYRRLVGPQGPLDEVVYPGVGEEWFSVERGEPPHPRPYLLYVGNVKPHKNVRGLLEAFGLLAEAVEHDLVIVGKREGFIHGDPEVVRRAEGLGGRVHFTGWVEDEVLRRWVANAAALVLPSQYEGFGLPPLEAMACGCPVVVSRVASLPEVCGEAAVYCDPRSPAEIAGAVRRLLREPGLREEMVGRGRERAREFGWERTARETVAVLARVMDAKY